MWWLQRYCMWWFFMWFVVASWKDPWAPVCLVSWVAHETANDKWSMKSPGKKPWETQLPQNIKGCVVLCGCALLPVWNAVFVFFPSGPSSDWKKHPSIDDESIRDDSAVFGLRQGPQRIRELGTSPAEQVGIWELCWGGKGLGKGFLFCSKEHWAGLVDYHFVVQLWFSRVFSVLTNLRRIW